MIILANGDEYTEAKNSSDNWKTWKDNSWAKHLGDILNSQVINLAISESSNEKIVRRTYHWLEKNVHLHKDLYVIIGWSSYDRIEMNWEMGNISKKNNYTDDIEKKILFKNLLCETIDSNLEKFNSLNPRHNDYEFHAFIKEYFDETYDDEIWGYMDCQRIFLFECYLKERGIKYLFFNAKQKPYENIFTQFIKNNPNYIDPYEKNNIMYNYLWGKFQSKDKLYFSDGYKYWAEFLKEKLC